MSHFEKKVPSNSDLFIASSVAFVIALLVLITIVLPAEFGIDPTGLGSILGLDELNIEESEQEIIVRSGDGEL